MTDAKKMEPRDLARAALDDDAVREAAQALRGSDEATLAQMLALGQALAQASGAEDEALRLKLELEGFAGQEEHVPEDRKAAGFASSFPVRALDMGLLDPEEIFLANREKFSQVTLTIVQPIEELQSALAQLEQGGVLALRVPASEVTGHSARTDDDTEVFIYILPREIRRIVESARARALESVMSWLATATDAADS